ncbi:MAG: hypothetical protein AB7Q17_03695 [Phycisphaerae bacterium]
MNSLRQTGLLILLASAWAGLAGCSRGGPKVSGQDLVGTWQEIPSEAPANQGARFANVPRLVPELRRLTFAADGTFKLVLTKADGTPLDESKAVEGKWRFEKGTYVIEIGSNKLPEKAKPWAPSAVGGLTSSTPGADGKLDQVVILHENGDSATYKRSG